MKSTPLALCSALALGLLAAGPGLADGPGSLGQGDPAPEGGTPGTDVEAAPVEPGVALTPQARPYQVYRVVEGSEQAWVQGAAHFRVLLDTPAFPNRPTQLFPHGTCHGLAQVTARWYWTYVDPIVGAPRPRGPAEAVTSSLAWNRQHDRPWHVYSANLAHFRLRAFTQATSGAYPFADADRTLERAAGIHDLQTSGQGAIANLQGGNEAGWPAPQLAQMLMDTLQNGPLDAGSPYSAGRPGTRGFAAFGFRMRAFPRVEGGSTYDFENPSGDGRHAILCYKFRRARVRLHGSGEQEGEGGEQAAVVFRFYDPNFPDQPTDPQGLDQGSPPPETEEARNLLIYLEETQQFTFSEGYQDLYRSASERHANLVQTAGTLTDPLGFDDFQGSMGSFGNPSEEAIRETDVTRASRGDADAWR